jgi:23S rRNA pseudouridine1911/1915/1917 synthase
MSRALRQRWRQGDRFLVRYADDALLVVEKKAGMLTVRAPNGKGEDLRQALGEFLGLPPGRQPPLAVHRLDRTVSGLLVFARQRTAFEALKAQFAAHEVERRYLAAVDGLLPDDEGSFESWLRSDPHTHRVYSSRDGDGEHAITHWRVRERCERAGVTLVEVELETGQRNQIRVHFAEAGFPLLGEKKYLDPEAEGASSVQGKRRIFLHAATLGFVHPNGESMRFEAELPPDLSRWLGRIRRGRKEDPGATPPGGRPHKPARDRRGAAATKRAPPKRAGKPKRRG